MKKIKIKIKGMHCPSCEALIKNALEKIWVKNIKINIKTSQVEMEFDDERISLRDIKKVIEKEGYEYD